MSQTDFLGINNHKFFQQLAKTIGADHSKALNIIAERQSVLYAWNKEDNCVLTLNIKAARENEESALNYQTLLPHSPPYFTPERLIVNETNTVLIAFGPNGVLVFEMPERTPPCGHFANNKGVIYCRTYSLLENKLSHSPAVECRQVRFHPGSPADSHFVVLTSDNAIRLFVLFNSTVSELASYALGPKPTGRIPDRNLSFLDALGDLAVDFDFSPPAIDELAPQAAGRRPTDEGRPTAIDREDEADLAEEDDEGIVWPIFILYGNGLVCKMAIGLTGEKCHPGLFGPLTFNSFPAGNLSDFCSILCIPCSPPVVVIAHCDGNLYHGLELPCDDEEMQELTSLSASIHTSHDHKPSYCKPARSSLYLFEVIEVELGMTANACAHSYTCPMYLERDWGKLGSYYAAHNAGVHWVNVEAVVELQQFANREDDEPSASESMFSNASTAEYLICTKTTATDTLNPVLGLGIVGEPRALVTFLANGKVMTLAIKDPLRSVSGIVEQTGEDGRDAGLNLSSSLISQTTPFDVYISNILKQSASQPILQVDTKNGEPSPEVCYEVLQRASKIFRAEHFVNLRKAREEIEKRSKQLEVLKEFQLSELNNIQKEKHTLKTNTENIAGKYEEVKEKQEEITRRCQMLLVLLSRKQTEPSIAEEKYFEKLKVYDKKVDGFAVAIEKMKDKMKYQRNQMANWKRENQTPEQLLPGQSAEIRQHLSETSKKIADITAEVKNYMTKLNISY